MTQVGSQAGAGKQYEHDAPAQPGINASEDLLLNTPVYQGSARIRASKTAVAHVLPEIIPTRVLPRVRGNVKAVQGLTGPLPRRPGASTSNFAAKSLDEERGIPVASTSRATGIAEDADLLAAVDGVINNARQSIQEEQYYYYKPGTNILMSSTDPAPVIKSKSQAIIKGKLPKRRDPVWTAADYGIDPNLNLGDADDTGAPAPLLYGKPRYQKNGTLRKPRLLTGRPRGRPKGAKDAVGLALEKGRGRPIGSKNVKGTAVERHAREMELAGIVGEAAAALAPGAKRAAAKAKIAKVSEPRSVKHL